MFDSIKGLKVLISGATGFIGKNLISSLLKHDAEVIAIVHSTQHALPQRVVKVVYDDTYVSLSNSLSGMRVDVVVHLATLFLSNHRENQIIELINSNVLFGTHLLEYAKQTKVPYFINTSTCALSIDHITYNPQNLYAATKKAFEDIIKYYEEISDIGFLTIELTDTYGPGDSRPKFINLALDAFKKNETFNMSKGEQEICYLFIEDAINAFLKAIELMVKNKVISGSKFSVYADEVYTLSNLVDYLQSLMEAKIKINKGYYPYRQREIMTFKPGFACLPEWEPEFRIKDGVKRILEHESN